MNDLTPMVGKLLPPSLKRTANSNKGSKQTNTQEMECTHATQNKSSPKKKRSSSEPPTLESADSFETTAAGAVREVSLLVSQFAEVLSQRAAADTSKMMELEGILTKARNLESYLKEKKSHLRQTLTLISDKLQG